MTCKHSDYLATLANLQDSSPIRTLCEYAEVINGTNFVRVNCTKPRDTFAKPDSVPYCFYKEAYYVDQSGRRFMGLNSALRENGITIKEQEVTE